MSEEKCANCGYDMCEGMAVYACEDLLEGLLFGVY